ncbi:MAG: hypothetical protein GWP08_11585 [Nitrospiraceae bacterium]|nr:hypothetical protein [Nitrospiraceae bacterium]
MQRMRTVLLVCCTMWISSLAAHALLFETRCTSEKEWDFLDYTGDAKIYPTTDRSCPPGYGPNVLHVEGGVVVGMPKGKTFGDGTILVLYRENDPREHDADGVILVRGEYGADISVEHNVKKKRPQIWLEQDNDTGFQFRVIDREEREFSVGERPGYGIVTDPWNVSGWIWQKVRVQGTRLQAKYWPAQKSEPDEWAIEAEYAEPGERFGLRINSGNIHVAYFAADVEDITRPAPPAYLLFPLPRATQTARIPLVLFANAAQASKEIFTVTVSGPDGECGAGVLDAGLSQGYNQIDFALVTDAAGANGGRAIVLDKEPASGLCTVSVTSSSGAFNATRTFEVRSMAESKRQIDEAAAQIDTLTAALAHAPVRTDRTAALAVIRDAASAHLARTREHFDAGQIENAELSFRFVEEALAELSGYKGAWLEAIAPGAAIDVDYDPLADRRGISDNPKDGFIDAYSKDWLLRFGTPTLQSRSFVMGRSYEVTIPWTVEGVTPDRDYAFRVALVSPLGNRTPAVSTIPPATPTSQWQPGTVYEHHVVLDVSPERPAPNVKIHEPLVLDEPHRILVTVTDPESGACLLLGNLPGPQPGRVGRTFLLEDVYVSSAPVEIREFAPSPGRAGEARRDRVRFANPGQEIFEGHAMFAVESETKREVWRQALPVTIPAGADAEVVFEWTPATAAAMTFTVQLVRGNHMVTEAVRRLTVAPPAGYDFQITRANHVEQLEDGSFVTPVSVDTGVKGTFSYTVRGGSELAAKGTATAPSFTIPATPWFGYYDVTIDCGGFVFERRLVATVVEASGIDLLVNGEPFIVKGTNVHGMDGGSPVRTAAMMRLMRDLGFNTWRGDYPAPWQIEMAYDLNTAYTVLAPFSCSSTADIFGRQVGPPMTTARELSRLFVERYRDSAGVLLWNSCNEVGAESVDFLISQYPVYKAFDPYNRPVHYANLYGQDYWQGQDVMGTNVYFGATNDAASRHPIITRTLDIARTAGVPLIFCEFNSYAGPIQTTGADAFRGLFAWGVEQGMAGGFHYMKGNSEGHPGIFDGGYNTHKVHNEAIIEAFADARIELVAASKDTARLRIVNKRRCVLRQVRLVPIVGGRQAESIELPDLQSEAAQEVDIALPPRLAGPTLLIEGELTFVTHHGFRCRVPVNLMAG